MPRLPRLHAPGAIYHVTARGNHRQDIFFKGADRKLLDEIMAHALDRTGARVHAYCWMTNHVHMLIQVGDRPLGALMQRVGSKFARLIQKSIPTTGHLFENRYHALMVDVDAYFLELVRYIHLNPVRAGIVNSPEQYRWSSHRVYLGKTEQQWIHTDFALSFFASDVIAARMRYQTFINEYVECDIPFQIIGNPNEPRVLGTDRFLNSLSIPVLYRHPKTTLETIAQDVCGELTITLEQLCSSSQHRILSRTRPLVAHRAITKQVASLSDVARFVNRSASALSRALHRHQL